MAARKFFSATGSDQKKFSGPGSGSISFFRLSVRSAQKISATAGWLAGESHRICTRAPFVAAPLWGSVFSELGSAELSDVPTDDKSAVHHEAAAKWVAAGESKYVTLGGGSRYITHPDWHSHSWLTLEEFASALEYIDVVGTGILVEYRALLAAMRVLARCDREVRIVFWFDN